MLALADRACFEKSIPGIETLQNGAESMKRHGKQARILTIDDNLDVLDIVSTGLGREGYDVPHARIGRHSGRFPHNKQLNKR